MQFHELQVLCKRTHLFIKLTFLHGIISLTMLSCIPFIAFLTKQAAFMTILYKE